MMLTLCAALATILLIASEILAIAPTGRGKRQRALCVWCAVPILLLFAGLWFLQIRDTISGAR